MCHLLKDSELETEGATLLNLLSKLNGTNILLEDWKERLEGPVMSALIGVECATRRGQKDGDAAASEAAEAL